MKEVSILTPPPLLIGTAGIVWAVSAHNEVRNPVLFVDNGGLALGAALWAARAWGTSTTLQNL